MRKKLQLSRADLEEQLRAKDAGYEHLHRVLDPLVGRKDVWTQVAELVARLATPVPMRLSCPTCGELHIDKGILATKPHHTHACQRCGNVWRPAIVNTVGVRFLPGFKNDAPPPIVPQHPRTDHDGDGPCLACMPERILGDRDG